MSDRNDRKDPDIIVSLLGEIVAQRTILVEFWSVVRQFCKEPEELKAELYRNAKMRLPDGVNILHDSPDFVKLVKAAAENVLDDFFLSLEIKPGPRDQPWDLAAVRARKSPPDSGGQI